MAMPSGNVVGLDKMQFASGGGAGGAGGAGGSEIHHHKQWYPDERDGFISWLRGEFAAANAIIDSLCHHLRSVGEPGEYDVVIGCIQQRRCNWNPVLHMQQYFSVAEVIYALQQVAWRRQPRYYDQPKVTGKEFRRGSGGYRYGHRMESTKEGHSHSVQYQRHGSNASSLMGSNDKGEEGKAGSQVGVGEKKSLAVAEEEKDSCLESLDSQQNMCGAQEIEAKVADDGFISKELESCDIVLEKDSRAIQNQNEKQALLATPKTFVGTEIHDGKAVNVVDGLKLYEEFLDDSVNSKIISLINELRDAGRRGQLQGQTFVVSKRPAKGHGREMIQLGIPVAEGHPDDDHLSGLSKGSGIQSIPAILQDVIDRLVGRQIVSVKPDSCIIDFYNEGDHSQPHLWPSWFGRPVCILSVTECNMTFGRVIGIDHPGDYRGCLNLLLAPGSLLVMEGKSADFAKHAISSVRKQRTLITFTKSQQRRAAVSDGQRPAVGPAPHWGQLPSRQMNHIRQPTGPKHYATAPTTGVLSAPPPRPQLLPPNGVQPLFVAAPMSFAAPVPPLPRHPSPRVPLPGTGVFLPPGSGNSPPPLRPPSVNATETSAALEPASPSLLEKENGDASPERIAEGKVQVQKQDCCNGRIGGAKGGSAVAEGEQEDGEEAKVVNRPASAS